MQQHVGECDFPIEPNHCVPSQAVVENPTIGTVAVPKHGYIKALFLIPVLLAGFFFASRKPEPIVQNIPPVVKPLQEIVEVKPEVKKEELAPTPVKKVITQPIPVKSMQEIPPYVFDEIEPDPPVLVTPAPQPAIVKTEPKPAVVVQPESQPQMGDPLGGVKNSDNLWLQADLNNVIVVKNPQPAPQSIDSEMEAVAKFLTTQANPAEAPYLRFFTFYAMPTDPSFTIGVNGQDVPISLRQAGLLSLSFVLNSTASIERSQGNIITPTMLPGSSTICYINIEDFGWTADQWDRISKTDPYVVEPLVQHSAYNLARLVGGNMLFRGDWFITHATDAQRQVDSKIPELIYYTLLYDKSVPKNGLEFRKALGIDLETALKDNLDRRVVMESGKSGVSIETGGNRKIQGIRTPFGYYWETFDTKNLDFMNNLELDDKLKDAGEIIASHKNGMQVYLLVNQDDSRVEFADNGLVEDTNPFGKKSTRPIDRRVRTASSCMICHTNGINPVSNSIVDSLKEGVQLNVLVHPQYDTYKDYQEFRKAREKYLKIDRKFVNNGINAVVDADNKIFEQAVAQANGLIPSQNAYLLWSVRNWYDKPLDLKQAAFECGLPASDYIEKTRGCISARVNRIVASDQFAIPRRYWENLNPAGDYAHSILTIKLHTPEAVRLAINTYGHPVQVISPVIKENKVEEPKPVAEAPKVEPPPKTITMTQDCQIIVTINNQQFSLGDLRKGESKPYISFDGTWYQVNHNGQVGFIFNQYCTPGGKQ